MSRQVKIVSPTGSPFAVAVMFFGNGLVLASSFSRMPGIRDQVGAIPTQLAFALVCVGIGSILPLDRALLAVAALVLLVAILAPVAREHGRELVKA